MKLAALVIIMTTLGIVCGCAGSTPIEKAAESYGYVVIATEAAADIVEDETYPLEVRRAIQIAERYSTPAARSLKIAAVAAIELEAAFNAGLASKEELETAYDIVLQKLAELKAPAADLFEAIGGK